MLVAQAQLEDIAVVGDDEAALGLADIPSRHGPD